MRLVKKRTLTPDQLARLENAAAAAEQNTVNIEDITSALVELGELFAEQDDALVELAGMMEEGE